MSELIVFENNNSKFKEFGYIFHSQWCLSVFAFGNQKGIWTWKVANYIRLNKEILSLPCLSMALAFLFLFLASFLCLSLFLFKTHMTHCQTLLLDLGGSFTFFHMHFCLIPSRKTYLINSSLHKHTEQEPHVRKPTAQSLCVQI